jgi:acetyltransferase-like isoleucine patch superfamily enzyme
VIEMNGLDSCIHYHHGIKGKLTIGKNTEICDNDPGKVFIDLSANITIGDNCAIGRFTQIYTHEHYHCGRDKTILQKEKEQIAIDGIGVKVSPLVIGNDVIIYGAIILPQVTNIPDGVVIGVGSVLTKNPGAYEIWAGNPARKIGER